jgi:hypothetical protein
MILGVVVIVIAGFLGWVSNAHFDGVLDLHIGAEAPIWFFIAEGLIDWCCMSLAMILAGVIVVRRRFRIVDVIGTQALARYPSLLSVAVLLPAPVREGFNRVIEFAISKSAQGSTPVDIGGMDVLFMGVVMLVTLLVIVWMVALMYRGYAVSCGTRGGKGIVSFIIGIIAAEILSKVVILTLVANLDRPI